MKRELIGILLFLFSSYVYSQIPVSIPVTSGTCGDTIDIPVEVGSLTGLDILSYQFVVGYDGAVLQALDVSDSGTLSSASGWTVMGNPRTDSILVGAFGANPLSGSGKLVKIKFRVIGNSGQISQLDLQSFIFNAGMPVATPTNGFFTVSLQKFLNYSNGWNLISVPLKTPDRTKDILFPNSISGAYTFVGTYIQKDTLTNGLGYWLKFSQADTVSIVGFPLQAETTSVIVGWNLIGSISEPIIASSIISEPPGMITSSIYGYKGIYFITDTIHPGKGYWVKVNQPGKLILSSDPVLNTEARIRIVPTSEMPPSPPIETSVLEDIPMEYAMDQCYPNPFNPVTSIKYQLPYNSNVTLRIYSLLGQEIKTLVDEIQESGYKQIEWNAVNIASGIYFYRIEATSISDPGKSFIQVRKMVLMK